MRRFYDSLVAAAVHIYVFVLLLLVENAESYSGSGPHIADVNILLPPKMTHPVEYRLQGSDGCFKWSWDHHDILSVLPEYNASNHCSTSARLKSIAPYSGRKETAVYATDMHTGMVIRCKVYIDNFSRVQIFHNSIKLDLDGLATLHVRAFDSQENVFSSLVGLKFMWHLRPEADKLPHHLVHVPLKDSPLSDCGGLCGDLDIQIRLEESGVFSDLYVVKGTEIGHETVSVHLLEPSHEQIGDTIVLTVAEAMSLDPPSPVFVLIGGIVQYTLKVIRGNLPQVVTLPSPNHQWSGLNSSVAQVDTRMGKAYALSLGVTTISVEDTRVAGHVQMSSLHVVLPDSLSLYILPLTLSGDLVEGVTPISSGSRWYVVSGRDYLVHMKVFSQGPGAQEIYLTENDDIKLHDNQSEFWNTFPLSDSITIKRGWWNSRILKATSSGLGKLTATLTYSGGRHETKEVLKVVQEVMVCEKVKITINTESILLPWAPSVYQEVELKARGGCAITSSDYKWVSSDMTTVSVSAFGIVQAKRPGKASIRVISIFDSFNYDEVIVEVSIPSSMVMLPNFPVETVVGSHLPAAVTLKASNGAYFYRCDAFLSSIRWETGSESFYIINSTRKSLLMDEQEAYESYTSSHGPPCAWTHVYASSSGRTALHATLVREYLSFDSNSGPIVLKTSSRIAAYSPLVVHQAGDGNQYGGYWFDLAQSEARRQLENLAALYLVPGTHMDIQLCGGPEPWNNEIEFVETVETLDGEHTCVKDGVFVHQTVTSVGSLYRIFCQKLGAFKLLFRRGNLVGEDHPLPAVAEVEMLLTCSFPSSIAVIADEAVNAPDILRTAIHAGRSPGRIRSAPVTVANGRTIRVSAVAVSDSGKVYGNSSSLFLRWEIGNCDGLAFWDDASSVTVAKSSWEKFLVLQNSSGVCILRATVVGLIDTMSGQFSTERFDSSKSVLTDAVTLQIVSTLRVNPEFNLLFFNPDAKLNLSITGGSCFLDVVVNDTRIVEVIQPLTGLQCSHLGMAPKGLGISLVTVHDIGLAPPVAASSVVQVADVDWIKVTSGEEISLMKGSSQSIDLLAGIHDGNTFDFSQYIYMNIRVHIEDHIIEIVDINDDQYLKAPNFIIQGRHLGVTTLYLSARQQSGLEILSQPVKIEVYAPPSIHPDYIFLVPGASYVLTVNGGPTIGAHIEYASMDGKTAVIEKSSGRLSAIAPGNTTLVARIYRNGDTMIGQAYGKVEVAVPSSVILYVQSNQLAIGREMPIFPSFLGGSLFSFYELCKDFKWTIEDEDVLSFQEAEHVEGDRHDDVGFIRVLHGKSAGRTDVSVSFSCDFVSSGSFSWSRLYNASVSLGVVPDLPLALGVPMTWILPPHYTSSDLLPLSSNTGKGSTHYSLMKDCSRKNEEAQIDAISIDRAKIKTTESNNLACIQAKDRLTGRTAVASCVRVAEVAQIRISTRVFTFRSVDLAVGAELYLPVTYCDDMGNPFYEAHNTLFDAETNYRDVVLISNAHDTNGKIHLKAMQHGKALVQVSFGSIPRKSDYILISVGAHLYPQNPVLRLGSHVNFSIEGLDNQALGRWSSANTSVLSIDVPSGKAEAIGEGTALIFFEGSGLKLQTGVTVLKGGNIVSVDPPKEMLTNAPFPAKGYGFSVRFSDASRVYDCSVEPPFVGYAKPWRDLDTSSSYCLFFPYSPEHLVRSIPKSKDMRQDISVTVSASLRGASHISGSASGLFVGGFSILEMGQSPLQMNLTSDSKKSVFTIVGNTDVEVHWEDRDQLLVMPIYREDQGIGGKAQYEVRVLRGERFQKKVIVTLPANGQRVQIDVNFEPGERKPLERTTNATLWAGVVGCFALSIVTGAAFICFLDRPERSQPTSFPATPSVAAPVTPERHNLAVVNEHSPRTPQPFIDYVRRTIDETPYYRQEGRRRFNPQNTY